MVVQGILQDLLGELVHLPKQELKLDLLNGHVLLGNLDVQPKALQVLLGLPLVVQAGMIGRVELHIPWSKLGTEPTRVLLDRVLLLVSPQSAEQLGSYEEKAATERKLVLENGGSHTARPQGHGVLKTGDLGEHSGETSSLVAKSSRHSLGTGDWVNFLGAQAQQPESLDPDQVGLP